MALKNILAEVRGGVGRLTLNRPDRLNSFTSEMHTELRAVLDSWQEDSSIRCLLITGAGRGFCAGQDLNERSALPEGEQPDLGASLDENYNPLIRRLRGLGLPVVCAVNGVAAGAGASLAFSADIVIAARSASFVMAFSRIGLIPDSGGTWFLPRLVGQPRAAALAMLGEKVPADLAERWGMIWRCVDDEELLSEAAGLAEKLASQPTRALAWIKQALGESWANSLDQQLDLERDLQRRAGRSDDYSEGVAAFMEKRDPVFKGH